ncbi:uncharacterized protein DNG_03264 [Cephalotrichum gorgonifer]|uniref:WD40 domain-containing protein n=1 Tax=Cephalotrichum gorgonifer TaxID=2041049 RepID=A0AAE8MVM3_9PEZI|nr:uncharacterized protein DNG_03264 [Cephalotrichum gorgonifer]
MPSSKKGKHAKDGGVAAAIAKQVAANKSANGSAFKDSTSTTPSPHVQSPDIKPTAVPAQQNVNPATTAVSPSLDAFSTTSISASTTQSADWMRGALSGSPGNFINMGESPPTQPSSYEDSGRLYPAWASPRAYMSPQPSASPSSPAGARRPLSVHAEGAFSTTDTRPQSSAAAYRRTSAASQLSNARISPHPPLPHQPQPHFYGVPDLDLDAASSGGLKAGERGYHFGFDTFPQRQSDAVAGSDSVVVVGYEGGLEVYSATKRGIDPVASLRGLRGGVYNAKILPWTVPFDGAGDIGDIYPLVAVVIHGPMLPSSMAGLGTDPISAPGSARPSVPGSPQPNGAARGPNQLIEYYQTSVEVYSLRTNQRIDVLLQASQVPTESSVSITSRMFSPPPPTGQFSIVADAESVGVASGLTGECWLYRQLPYQPGDEIGFGCVAKLWTSIRRAPRTDQKEEGERSHATPAPHRPAQNSPILALNGRWLAYCPPSPSSQFSLRAHVPVPVIGKGPGVSTVTAPPVPPSTIGTDLPISDGIVNKLMRETTQELIHGAKWVGQQGKQAWNAYWSRSPNQPQVLARSPTAKAQPWGSSYPPRQDGAQFPPTHGSPGQAPVAKDPGLVSIVDLEAVGSSSAIHAVATFTAPSGCSFLSFSPTGLSLFTVSSKGDVQTVWDLLRLQYTKSSPLQALAASSGGGPRVRQIAQFSRMTVARVVDVAWSKPNGRRIAMVTERGTAHLLDMPQNAFAWPPPRPRRDVPEPAVSPEPSSSAVSIASSAIGAAWGAARPLMNRPRRSSSISTGFTGSSIVDSASHGGRAIASSISNSLGKTGNAINHLRQTGENRVALPPTHVPPTLRCVAWVSGRKRSTFFAAAAGVVRVFPSRKQRSSNWALRGMPYRDFNVPGISDDILAPIVRHFINGDDELYLSDRDMEAGNTVTLNPKPVAVEPDFGAEASIPQAEIESSAPYQPFHTDRRVALYEYSSRDAEPKQPAPVLDTGIIGDLTLGESAAPKKKKKKGVPITSAGPTTSRSWAFGQAISSTELDLGFSGPAEDSVILTDEHRALPPSAMERVMQVGENDEQIVVTTRRRRSARHSEHDDDGFFEDDCEVLDFADQRV